MEHMTFEELTDELMRLYPQGKYAEALEVVTQNADRFPEQTARTTFWKLCLLSLCGRSDEVLSLFQKSLDAGLWWSESQFRDTDLNAVRDLPEFQRLVAQSSRRCVEMQAHIQPARTLLVPANTAGELPLLIALHGRNGHSDSNLEHWEIARRRGWLVLSPQSRQALYHGSYCWDDSEQGLKDILFHLDEVRQAYHIDHGRVVIAGFSQGSGMAIHAALGGQVGAHGFIGVGTFIAEPDILIPLAQKMPAVRGYFITGEKDHTLDKTRAIQKILQANNIPFREEAYPDLGHEFSPDFESSFDRAIQFILE